MEQLPSAYQCVLYGSLSLLGVLEFVACLIISVQYFGGSQCIY